jgi:hypothetical protein
MDKEHKMYHAEEGRPTYTNQLTVEQCRQKHSELKAQVKRLGVNKRHMLRPFVD